MIDPEVPLVIAICLAVLLAIVLALLLGHAAWARARDRRLEQPLARARTAVAQAVDGHTDQNEARAALAALPMNCRITVLADLAPTLRGVQRDRLELLARESGVVETAERWVCSRRWWRRLHAARVYTLLQGSGGPIGRMLDDPAWEVRAEAAQWVALAPTDADIARLVAMLDDTHPLPRFAAKDSLRRIGGRAAGPLATLLADVSGAQAAAALEVATAVATPAMLAPALRLTEDELPETRCRAAAVLSVLGGEQAVTALERLLGDPDPDVRAGAATALGKLGHWPAATALAARLGDQSWEVRRAAALSLRELRGPGVVLLRRALERDDRFAADIAQQVLDLPDSNEEAVTV
jgi:HEAT repeat protein